MTSKKMTTSKMKTSSKMEVTSKMKMTMKKEDDLKNEDDSKSEDDIKNEDDLKNEEGLKKENDHKNEDDLKKTIWPIPLKRILPDFFWMTSHLNRRGTTDIEGTCSLTKHTWRWTYSACCLVRFASFFTYIYVHLFNCFYTFSFCILFLFLSLS